MDDAKRQLWTNLVADFETSGLSQRAYAAQKQISLSNLRYWMYKLRNQSRPLATEQLESAPEQRHPRRARRLLAVDVVASAAPKARPPEDGMLELALPSGLRLRFHPGVDLDYLRELAAAL
jgi:transposase